MRSLFKTSESRQKAARSGFTLVELVISLGAATVLLAGLSTCLLVSNAALSPTGNAVNQKEAYLAQRQLSEDMNLALRFTERTATAATFTVPDRTGDGVPEVVRYAWSGVTGDPLTYQINESTAVAIAENVQNFQMAYQTRFIEGNGILGGVDYADIVYEDFKETKEDKGSEGITVDTPGGTEENDLLIAVVTTDNDTSSTMVAEAGWSLLHKECPDGQVTSGVWYKQATASEPDKHNFLWTDERRAYACIIRFSGVNIEAPLGETAFSTGTSKAPEALGVTTTIKKSVVLRVGSFKGDSINKDDPGVLGHTAILMKDAKACSSGAAYLEVYAPKTIDPAQFTLTNDEDYVTGSIVIQPMEL